MFCSKDISPNEKYVLLGTYNLPTKPNEENFFHFICWLEWFNTLIKNKARENTAKMQQQAIQLFNNPAMKERLSQLRGSEQVMKMLSTPLTKKNIEFVEEESKKIKDDKNTKKGDTKGRKTQVR